MEKIILLLQKMPMGFFAFFFLFSFFLLYMVLYIYLNKNLNRICVIIFNEKKRYKSPLEIFDFLYISFLPTTFWKEILNIKKRVEFNKLYDKSFYLKMDEIKLNQLIDEFPCFFVLQYIILVLGLLFMILMLGSYFFEI